MHTSEQRAVWAGKMKLQAAKQRLAQARALLADAAATLEGAEILDLDLPALLDHIDAFTDTVERTERHLASL